MQHAGLHAPNRQQHRMLRHKHPLAAQNSVFNAFGRQGCSLFFGHVVRAATRHDSVESYAHERVPDDTVKHHVVIELEVSDTESTDARSAKNVSDHSLLVDF
ncbi:MAG: hypothetical protein CL912_13540 [Deltaproteobacteria bacterium]|nr:hypothetical protein [Deltaproteobacteria bacterium]